MQKKQQRNLMKMCSELTIYEEEECVQHVIHTCFARLSPIQVHIKHGGSGKEGREVPKPGEVAPFSLNVSFRESLSFLQSTTFSSESKALLQVAPSSLSSHSSLPNTCQFPLGHDSIAPNQCSNMYLVTTQFNCHHHESPGLQVILGDNQKSLSLIALYPIDLGNLGEMLMIPSKNLWQKLLLSSPTSITYSKVFLIPVLL